MQSLANKGQRAKPSQAKPSRAEPSQAEPSRAKPSQAKFAYLFFICQENFMKNLLGKFHAELSQQRLASQAEPSQAKPSQVCLPRLIYFFYFFYLDFCQENFMKNLSGKFHEKLCLHFLCLLYICAKNVSSLFVSILFLFFVRKIS